MSRQNKDCKEQDCSQSVRNGCRRRNKEKRQRKAEPAHSESLEQSNTSKQMDSFLSRRGIFCWYFGHYCFVGLDFFAELSCIFAVLLIPYICYDYYYLPFH